MKTSLFIRIRSQNVLIEASTVRTKVTLHPWLVPAPFWRLLANNTCLGPVPWPEVRSPTVAADTPSLVTGIMSTLVTGTPAPAHIGKLWGSCSHASSSYTPKQQHYIRGAFLTFTPCPIISCNNFSV